MTTISSLPFPLDWTLEPQAWDLAGDKLTITSGARTDLFVDPGGSAVSRNMPRLTGSVSGDDIRFTPNPPADLRDGS
jgi:hypothetical protein